MLNIELKRFKKKVEKEIDEALVIECNIKVANPSKLVETILNLCKEYHEKEKELEIK